MTTVKKKSVFVYFKEQIDELKMNGKLGTARNYKNTLRSFSKFLEGKDIPFSSCQEKLILKYDAWLDSQKASRNTKSFYMRALCSVYNKAVEQRFAKQTYPFRNVYTGVDRTRKRAVDEQAILQLQELDLSSSSPLALARDLFMFSYATRGMAFVDIAFLRKDNIRNDTIIYTRRKTGQSLTIHIELCIRRIIERYWNSNSSPYLFPLISSTEPVQAYRQYQTALGYYNRLLKVLGKKIEVNIPLSSYTSRHTWATVARNQNIPISVISAGMGHTSENTTQIYLASLETSVIDLANQQILKALNK